MLRINLLPRYIEENAQKKKWIAAWVVGLVVVIALFGVKITDLSKELTAAQSDKDTADSNKTKYDDFDTKIKKVNDDVAKIKEKQDFIANAQKYNEGWPTVFSLMRDVTSTSILLKSLNIDPSAHKTLSFTGFAKDEMTVVRWWMYLRNNTDKFDSVFFNLPTHPYVPATANTTATGTFASGMGAGGFGGGPSSAKMAGMGMMGGGGSMGASMAGFMAGRRGGGMGGGGFGGGATASGTGADVVEGRPGLSFSAQAVLKQPMSGGIGAPSWPPGGGGAGTGMMMGGGMPGMPPGMMGGGMPPGMMGGPGRGGRMGGGGKAGGE